jgi:hypothetical protein
MQTDMYAQDKISVSIAVEYTVQLLWNLQVMYPFCLHLETHADLLDGCKTG